MRQSLAEHPVAYLPTPRCPGCCRTTVHKSTAWRKGQPGPWGQEVRLQRIYSPALCCAHVHRLHMTISYQTN